MFVNEICIRTSRGEAKRSSVNRAPDRWSGMSKNNIFSLVRLDLPSMTKHDIVASMVEECRL